MNTKKPTKIGGVLREKSLNDTFWWPLPNIWKWIKNKTINKKTPFRKERMANVEGKVMPTTAKPKPPPSEE